MNPTPSHKKTAAILILVLVISNAAWVAEYMFLKKEIVSMQMNTEKITLNTNVLSFTQMFIAKVIQSNTEVDFDTRLKLENAVRNIKDPEILAAWQAFIDSKTEVDAQNKVKNLLGILISKVQM